MNASQQPHLVGNSVLELTFKVGTGGIYKYRTVILDSATGVGVGDNRNGLAILPTAGSTDGQNLLGVCNGPLSAASLDPTTPNPVIAAGIAATIRLIGTIAVQTDTSTSGTPITAGCYVANTATGGQEGRIKKAALSANAGLTPDQHVLGIAFSRVNKDNGYTIVLIDRKEV